MEEIVAGQVGRYELRRELGRGAMGVVYEAWDPLLGRTVALKTIRPAHSPAALQHREAFERRFFAEAQAAARLSHPAVVVVHDVGRDTDSGDLFIALEYLHGRTLADVVDADGPLPWRQALALVSRLAAALQHAHEHGVVHRDVKPDNVMCLPSGDVKLMDFGIAKLEETRLTVAGEVFGTPRYMSPEQAHGQAVDARSDLFALGSVAYLLVTGRHAFDGPTTPAVLLQVTAREPLPPSAVVAVVPTSVNEVVARAMAKAPEGRYQTAVELMEDLEDVLADRPPRHARDNRNATLVPLDETHDLRLPGDPVTDIQMLVDDAPPRPPVDDAPAPPPVPVAAPAATPAASPSPARRAALPLAVAGLVILGAAAWLFVRGRTAMPPAAAMPIAGHVDPAVEPAASTGGGATIGPPAAEVAATATLAFGLDHSVRAGRVRVLVDGQVVLTQSFSGQETRSLGVLKKSRGRVAKALTIPAGTHTVRVEVTWDDNTRAKEIRGQFAAGRTRALEADLGGLRKGLSLELR